MHGKYKVRVKNSRNSYTFSLNRNITILKGMSGRGKSTLFDMIREHNRFGKNSGVSISCDRELIAVDGDRWEDDILQHPGCIIVIDEDSHFIRSKDFVNVVKGSDNYYLLITRTYLQQLPISVDEIYELTGEKNKRFKKIYREIDRIYDSPQRSALPYKPQVIITEDSRAGYHFFKKVTDHLEIPCVSAGGKSNVLSTMNQYPDKDVVVIADGAAFGPEMEDIVRQQHIRPNKLAIYLPESFEWIVLSSGVVHIPEMSELNEPEVHADSTDYLSWEQYFTDLLVKVTKDSAFKKYSKSRLADFYLQEGTMNQITGVIKGIDLQHS